MPEALRRVKAALGDSAVIISTRTTGGGDKPRGVEIMASAGPARPLPRVVSRTPLIEEQLLRRLVENEVSRDIARQIVQQARQTGGAPDESLRAAVRDFIRQSAPAGGGIDLSSGPRRVALVGPPGAGKTTTLAKLAAHFKLRLRRSVAVLSLDMHRMGATEQLKRYTEIIGVELFAAQTVEGLTALLPELRADLLLIDTPGVGLREAGTFARLAALLRAVRPDEVHLVLPISSTEAVQERAARLFKPLNIARLVLTRLDEAVGFGVVLNVLQRLGCGVSYLSAGQNVPRDLEEACDERLAELLFQ